MCFSAVSLLSETLSLSLSLSCFWNDPSGGKFLRWALFLCGDAWRVAEVYVYLLPRCATSIVKEILRLPWSDPLGATDIMKAKQ